MLLFYRRTPYTLPRSYKRLTFAPFPPPPAPDSGSGAAPRRTLRGSHRPGCEGCTGRRPRTNPDPGCTVRGSPPPPPRIPAPLRGPTKPLTSPRSAPPFSGRRRVMEPGKDPGAASRRRCGLELRPRPLPFLRGWPRRGPAPPALAAPLRAAAAVPLLRHDAVAPRSAGSGAAPMRGAAAVRNSARGSLLRPPPRFPFFFCRPFPPFPSFLRPFPLPFPSCSHLFLPFSPFPLPFLPISFLSFLHCFPFFLFLFRFFPPSPVLPPFSRFPFPIPFFPFFHFFFIFFRSFPFFPLFPLFLPFFFFPLPSLPFFFSSFHFPHRYSHRPSVPSPFFLPLPCLPPTAAPRRRSARCRRCRLPRGAAGISAADRCRSPDPTPRTSSSRIAFSQRVGRKPGRGLL